MSKSNFYKTKRHTVDVLFLITLFCVFAISVITLTGTGATVYEHIVDRMDSNFVSRSSFSYVINKVRQNDRLGNVSIGKYGEADSIIISEEISNTEYCTYLYYYDGSLREIFSRKDQFFDLNLGNSIIELSDFQIEKISDSLCKVVLTNDGNISTLYINVRSTNQ